MIDASVSAENTVKIDFPWPSSRGDADGGPLRCAFVHAPDPVYSDTQNYGAKFMPVWAYTLAAHIPADERFELALYDTRFDALESIGEADVFLFSGIKPGLHPP